jgi:glycerophosphoryl diester phosphodiesterase
LPVQAARILIMATPPASASADGQPRPAISAHRGGSENAPPGTYDAYRSALAIGADLLEFDVRRTTDDQLVAFHDQRAGPGRPVRTLNYADLCSLVGYEVPTVAGVIRLLADRGSAHIDLKERDCLAAVAAEALSVLEPARIIVTTGDAAAIMELRRLFPVVPCGLTIGGDLGQTARYLAERARGRVRSRVDAVSAVKADWAVVHERLAEAGALAECRRRGLATMVWTVDDDTALARWVSRSDVDVLVTNRPRRAVELRRQERH